MSTTRTAMADRVNIGQTWRRKRDGAVFSVRQIWRADREARLIRPSEGTFPDMGAPDRLILRSPTILGAGLVKLELSIRLGNEAMQTNGDIADALRQVAGQFARYGTERPVSEDSVIRDSNGNTVGRWEIA